jgi:hypothetical protein
MAQSRDATWYPMIGCWFICKIVYGLTGVEPMTSPLAADWQGWSNRLPDGWFLLYMWHILVLNLVKGSNDGEKGRGLAPTLGAHHTTTAYNREREVNTMGRYHIVRVVTRVMLLL